MPPFCIQYGIEQIGLVTLLLDFYQLVTGRSMEYRTLFHLLIASVSLMTVA